MKFPHTYAKNDTIQVPTTERTGGALTPRFMTPERLVPMPSKRTIAECSIDGCVNQVVAFGWCSTHYARWRKHGSPHIARAPLRPVADRFWEKVKKTDTCWLWTGAKSNGYGSIRIDGKAMLAHRWSYEQIHGQIPAGLDIDHLCCIPACVNPEHLEAVTHYENVRRAAPPPPTHCPHGHEYTPENTYWGGPVKRNRKCRECNRIGNRKQRSQEERP